jgi:hypothetical protein
LERIVKRTALATLTSLAASALLVVAVLATPVAAHAQAAEDVWAAISVEIYDVEEGKEPTLVLTGRALEGLELPIEASLAIPKDVGVSWMGQAIEDTNPDTWPQVEDAELIEGDEYNVVEFTLTEAPAVQLEIIIPEGWVTDGDDGRVIDAEYTLGGDASAARIGVSTTHEYMLVDADPEPKVDVRQTDIFYSAETTPVAGGDVIRISGIVVEGTAPELIEVQEMMEQQSQGETGAPELIAEEPIEIDTGFSISPTTVILIVLGLLILVVVFFIYRTISSSTPDEDEESEEGDEHDEAEDEFAEGETAGFEAEETEHAEDDAFDEGEQAEQDEQDAPAPAEDDADEAASDDDEMWGEIDDE